MQSETEIKLNKVIGNRLYLFRKQNSIRKKEICNFLNISVQQLNKYESGENRISATKLLMFLKHYNINSSYFFEESKRLEKISELLFRFSKLKSNAVRRSIVELIRNVVDNGM
jgi:transcriptional regulator with XRE-family HTH domain